MNENELIIDVSGNIGEGASSKEYLSYLIKTNPDKDLRFNLSSLGGSFNTALNIYGLIKQHKGKTTAYYEAGMSASATTLIASACDVRIANPYALGLVHKVLTPVMEWSYMNEDDIKEAIERLEQSLDDVEKMTKLAVSIYANIFDSKYSKEDIAEILKAEKWLTAEEMLEYGLVTEIDTKVVELDNTAKNEMRLKFAASVSDLKLPELPNTFLNTKNKKMSIKDKLTEFFKNSFGLNESDATDKANEFATVATDAIQKTFDAKLDEAVASKDYVSRETYNSLQERVDAMQNSIEKFQERENKATPTTFDITPFENKLKGVEDENATLKTELEKAQETIATFTNDIATLKTAVGTKQIEAVNVASKNNGVAPVGGDANDELDLSKMTAEERLHHQLSGYTSKIK